MVLVTFIQHKKKKKRKNFQSLLSQIHRWWKKHCCDACSKLGSSLGWSTMKFLVFELTLCVDPSWRICSRMASRESRPVWVTRKRSGLWFYPQRPPSFIYLCQLSHWFNVMLVLTVFGQSQSSIMTIGCEWISWIHWGTMAPIQTNRWEGPIACPLLREISLLLYPLGWYVVGTWRTTSVWGRSSWRRKTSIGGQSFQIGNLNI